jgi:GGDEF domain-containing protein
MPVPLNSAVALGERLRFTQSQHVEQRDLYRPVEAIGRGRAEPCGTFSVGVAQRGPDESLEQCLERADKALYEAKKTRNAVCVSHPNPAEGSGLERYADYARKMKGTQANPAAPR